MWTLLWLGIEPYKVGRKSAIDKSLTLDWLICEGFVVKADQQQPQTVVTMTPTFSHYDFDDKNTRKGNPNEGRTEHSMS